MEKNSSNSIKVTVCVSFYNASLFVEQCVDILCAQTLGDALEIVLVNDGSKDDTEELMHTYAKKHPDRRIVLVTQENKSLCHGRQTGVRNASGEYITFLDQDDKIDATAYEKMYCCAKEYDADIVEIKTRHGDEVLGAPFAGLKDSHEVLKYYFEQGGMHTMLWMRMYRRTLFDKPVLPDLYTNNEDMFGLPCLLHAAHSIYYLPEVLHTYTVDNVNSFMVSTSDPKNADKRFKSRALALKAPNHFRTFVGEEGLKEYGDSFNRYRASNAFSFLMLSFLGKGIKDKEKAVIEETGLNSSRELRRFLREWLPNRSLVYRMYKALGLNLTYKLYHLIHKAS